MTLPPNLQLFNLYAAKYFALLYENFPAPLDIHIDDLKHEWNDETLAALIQADNFGRIANHTAAWLRMSNYTTYHGYDETAFLNESVLTAKGLEILKSVQPSLNTEKSIGEFLADAVKVGQADLVNKAMRVILAQGVQYLPFVGKASSKLD